MGWGALMGAGQGLQQVGGMLQEMNKDKLQAKLKEESAIREEKRAQTRLETTPDASMTEYIQTEPNGPWMEQTRSKTGAVLESKLAPPSKIESLTQDAEKRKMDLYRGGLEVSVMEKDAANYDADRALRNRGAEADILQSERSGQASMINATRPRQSDQPAKAKTAAQLAEAIRNSYPDVIKTATAGEGDEQAVDANYIARLSNEIAAAAIASGNSSQAGTLFLDALQKRTARQRRAMAEPSN